MFDPKDPELRKPKMIIYQIRNIKNNKSYIGQSTKTFCKRYSDGNAWWRPLGSKATHLSNAVAKDGLENFEVCILKKNVKSLEELNRLEVMYIEKFNTMAPNGYNYHEGGINTAYWNRSIDSRDRMALGHSGGKKRKLLNNKTGIIYEFVNVNRFAKEHGLSTVILIPLLNGTRYHSHRGWSLPEKPIKKFKLLSPSGEQHIILQREIAGFCRKQDIPNNGGMLALLSGKNKVCHGWTLVKDSA